MWKAFDEMESLGWLESDAQPQMVTVQATGCAPVVQAIESGIDDCDFWNGAETIAAGLRVPKSFADRLILEDIQAREGTAVAVSDEEILDAQRRLGTREGIFAAPEGAATLAGLMHLIEASWVHPDERIILFNTGSGLKYLETVV